MKWLQRHLPSQSRKKKPNLWKKRKKQRTARMGMVTLLPLAQIKYMYSVTMRILIYYVARSLRMDNGVAHDCLEFLLWL